MATEIFEHNIPELYQGTKNPALGSFQVSNIIFPEINLMDVHWQIPNDLIIHETNPSQTIDMNFVLDGNIKGIYKGLNAEFGLNSGTNNMKFTPSVSSSHHAIRQDVEMFAVGIEKNYFQKLIGHDNAWAESIQRKLENEEDFFGSKEFLPTTPRMNAVLHSIRTMKPSPMTRIMTQSLAFELIALQVEQLACLAEVKLGHDDISATDVEKLHKAKDFIERHYLEDLSLTSICREVMLNEFKLKKGFKALFDTTVIQYARQLRMEFAQNLLRNNKMTVEEVSAKLGYRYPNHFTVAYKKHFGVVPSKSAFQ